MLQAQRIVVVLENRQSLIACSVFSAVCLSLLCLCVMHCMQCMCVSVYFCVYVFAVIVYYGMDCMQCVCACCAGQADGLRLPGRTPARQRQARLHRWG